MDHSPLRHLMNSDAALGVFDPLALGLTFSCARPGVTGTDAAIPGTYEPITDADTIVSMVKRLQRDVPVELLAHEMTHLYQVTATSSGIREFMEMHRYLVSCCRAITAMAAHRGGEVPVGFLSRRDSGALPADLRDLVASLDASRNALLALKGGVLLPLTVLAPYRMSQPAGNLFGVKGIFPGDDVVWCMDLTGLGGPAGMAVTLGNVQLFEGQAHLVEYFRAAGEASRGTGRDDLWSSLNSAPAHPYQLARSIYLAHCRDRPVAALPADLEFFYVTDAALMADDWATIEFEAVATGAYEWSNGNAFNHFLQMCLALSYHPGWRLTSMEPDHVVEFQDALLRAAGAPVTSVAALTTAAREKYSPLLAEIRRESPLFGPMIAPWAKAFALILGERLQYGRGRSTGLALARMPHEDLAVRAMDLMTTTFVQPVSLTDDIPEREVLSVVSLPQAKTVLVEILYGGRPCELRARCGLPERAACSGLPSLDELEPKGRRCMRECAVTNIVELTGINRLTN